ncbi:MAG: glycosyltransferase [Bacteroidota bacterium]
MKKIIIEDIAKRKPDLIYCQLIRTAEFVRGIKDIPKLLDYMDVFSKGVERRIEKVPFYLKPIFRMEYHRLLKYENDVFNDFTYKTIISEQDRALIPHADNEKISIIPNGVDMEYFKPIDIEKKYDILFSGNMSYPPNVDSAVYIVEKILPLIVKHFPHIKILIAGASPTSKVLSLKSENVEVMGWVDDISICFAESRMLVAPMQLSIGLQNKLLQAMAMKMPVVTSVLANNALHARPGKEILVANTPEEYAVHIITLLNEKSKAEAIAENGYRFIQSNYTWVAMDELLNKIIT